MIKALSLKQGMIIGIVALLVLAFASIAYANPFYTGPRAASDAATSTQVYMTPGTATSTTVYDSYEANGTNQRNTANITIANTVAVTLQGVSSSSISVLNLACEFSDDGVDWYQNELYPATSTGPLQIGTPVSYQFTFASTTVNGVSFGNRFAKVVQCPVPLRYVRAVVTNTGANLSVWTGIYPTKQRN